MTRMEILIFVCFCLIVWDNFLWMSRIISSGHFFHNKTRSSCSTWWSRWDSPAIILDGGCGSTAGVLFTRSVSLLDIPTLIICWFGWWKFGSCCRWSLICAPNVLFLKCLPFSCFYLAIIFWVASKVVWKISLYSTPASYLKKLVSFSNIFLIDLANFDALFYDPFLISLTMVSTLSEILSLKSNFIWLLL